MDYEDEKVGDRGDGMDKGGGLAPSSARFFASDPSQASRAAVLSLNKGGGFSVVAAHSRPPNMNLASWNNFQVLITSLKVTPGAGQSSGVYGIAGGLSGIFRVKFILAAMDGDEVCFILRFTGGSVEYTPGTNSGAYLPLLGSSTTIPLALLGEFITGVCETLALQ